MKLAYWVLYYWSFDLYWFISVDVALYALPTFQLEGTIHPLICIGPLHPPHCGLKRFANFVPRETFRDRFPTSGEIIMVRFAATCPFITFMVSLKFAIRLSLFETRSISVAITSRSVFQPQQSIHNQHQRAWVIRLSHHLIFVFQDRDTCRETIMPPISVRIYFRLNNSRQVRCVVGFFYSSHVHQISNSSLNQWSL